MSIEKLSGRFILKDEAFQDYAPLKDHRNVLQGIIFFADKIYFSTGEPMVVLRAENDPGAIEMQIKASHVAKYFEAIENESKNCKSIW